MTPLSASLELIQWSRKEPACCPHRREVDRTPSGPWDSVSMWTLPQGKGKEALLLNA